MLYCLLCCMENFKYMFIFLHNLLTFFFFFYTLFQSLKGAWLMAIDILFVVVSLFCIYSYVRFRKVFNIV